MAVKVDGNAVRVAAGLRSLALPTGDTRQSWVNYRRSKCSYLQKFGFAVQPKASRPATRGVSRSSRDAGRDAVAATASAREAGCRAGNREQPPARYDTALTAFLFGLYGERTPAVVDCGRECARTEKSCGPDARGLCVKSCGDVAANRYAHQSSVRATGAIVHRSPRRARRTPSKPSAQGRPGDRHACRPPRARSSAHAGLRVPPALGLPCALRSERAMRLEHTPGETRRGIARACPQRISDHEMAPCAPHTVIARRAKPSRAALAEAQAPAGAGSDGTRYRRWCDPPPARHATRSGRSPFPGSFVPDRNSSRRAHSRLPRSVRRRCC